MPSVAPGDSFPARPLRLRRPRHRLARAEERPGRRDRCRPRAGGRGGDHRLVRRDRRGSSATSAPSRSRTGATSGAPSRSVRASCSRGDRSSWSPRPGKGPQAPTRTASGSVAVPGRQGAGRAGQPDLRRGPPRRRAGREGLGRRPADRGRGRGVPRRRRRPRREAARLPARARSGGSAYSSTTSCRARRRAGSPRRSRSRPIGQARADRRATRSSTSGPRCEPAAARQGGLADGPAHHRVEEGRLPAASAGRTATRPTSPARGSTSSAASAASRTSTRRCSVASRS